jgi:hypothetical protein
MAKEITQCINGIWYILKEREETAMVTNHPDGYSGEVVIPESVTFNGVEYKVTSIGIPAPSRANGQMSNIVINGHKIW